MKIPSTDLVRPHGINCILARDKLDNETKYSAVNAMDNLLATAKNSIPQINILESEYDAEYLSARKDRERSKILIVEDRDRTRDYLCLMLRSENFQVIEAQDSDTAIELAYSKVPDLIICELLMPIVNGYGVIASLCHSTVTSEIPVLFITAHLEQTDDSSQILSIFDRETIEPLTKQKLLETISNCLGIAVNCR